MLKVRFRGDFFCAPVRKLPRQHKLKSFAEGGSGRLASELQTLWRGEIGDLQFALGLGETFSPQRDAVPVSFFEAGDSTHQVTFRVPRLQCEPSIPFG